MLNPFNELLDFVLYAPIALRVAVGIFFIILGYEKYTSTKDHLVEFLESLKIRPSAIIVKILGGVEVLIGLMFIIGLFTQIAAIIGGIISFVSFILALRQPDLQVKKPFEYALVCVICISLLLTGAGLFALDMPL